MENEHLKEQDEHHELWVSDDEFPKLDPLDGEEELEKELNSISSNEVLASERDEEITDDKVFEESLIFSPLSKADHMEHADAIVLEKEENKYETPIDLYQTMTNGCTTVRDELKGLMVFQRLKEPRMETSVISLGYLSHLYTKCGKVSKTLEASKDVKAYSIEHNKKKYSTLVNGYVQLNDCATTSAIYEEMMRSGFNPDFNSTSLNHQLARIYNFGKSENFGDRFVEPLAATQTLSEDEMRWFQGMQMLLDNSHGLLKMPETSI
eukprot:Gb_20382 [translate_table: standard]